VKQKRKFWRDVSKTMLEEEKGREGKENRMGGK